MTEISALIILAAFLLDLLLGDPVYPLHPVRVIGWLIKKWETPCRRFIKNERIAGIMFALSIVIFIWAIIYFFIDKIGGYYSVAGICTAVFFIYSAISVKDLKVESMKVYDALKRNNLTQARQKLAMIVGRDTHNLDEPAIIRATIETVAENTVDGIISPLFYAFLAGAPLAFAYKAINTLDSMVGYKNEKYKRFGWASAKLDDWANFIPARMSAVFLPLAGLVCGKNIKDSWRIMLRDGDKTPSPNSAIPEAAVAGALGVQLGGNSFYNGVICEKPYLGEDTNSLTIAQIKESITISYICALMVVLSGIFLQYFYAKFCHRI